VKYSIVTFGCRVNQADSLQIEEALLARGATESPMDNADVVIVNTCSVTATADQGARQTIRRIARDNPSARIVVTGCYATRRPDEVSALPNVLRVVRNARKEDLVAELTTAERFGNGDGACGASIEPGLAGRTVFTLRVQTGCEEHCSYCIIPTTRGAGRSLRLRDVLDEVVRIASAGFKEIVLTGVHLGSYGRDVTPRSSLFELLRALDELAVDLTFRISSLEPMDCTPAIVKLVADSNGRFAPHFHLPLQHASNRMLALMHRPYTLDDYKELVNTIADRMPHASIGSDMIVGFPGETEADFARNLEYLPGSPLTHLHVFPYSDRPGTPASGMCDKVAGPTVRERSASLRSISRELADRFRNSQRGTIRRGLTIENGQTVVTDNYLKLQVNASLTRNVRVMVRVLDGSRGEVLDQL
jgi:threonylcarbamoyladenosine tRNA methylthiotransferase MtaB